MLLRGARPFEAKLYLICLNNKCFDFKVVIYILISIVTYPGSVISELRNALPEARNHRLARLAGRVIDNAHAECHH